MIALFSTDMIPPRLHQNSLIYLFFGKIRSRTPFSIARFGTDLRVFSESGWMRSTLKAQTRDGSSYEQQVDRRKDVDLHQQDAKHPEHERRERHDRRRQR